MSCNLGAQESRELQALCDGYKPCAALKAACGIELFDKIHDLGDSTSVSKLCEDHSWKQEPTLRFLNGLTSLDVLEKEVHGDEEVFRLTAKGHALRRGVTDSLWQYPFFIDIFQEAYENIPKVLKEGYSSSAGHNHTHQKLQKCCEKDSGSRKWAVNKGKAEDDCNEETGEECLHGDCCSRLQFYRCLHGMLKPEAKKIVQQFDLSGFHHAVDLGCGSGALSAALATEYPKMKVTMIEQEGVVSVVREHFLPEMNELNVELLASNFLTDELPASADLFVMSLVLHHIEQTQILELLKRLQRQMRSGGAVMIVEKFLHDNLTGPCLATLWDMQQIHNYPNRMRSVRQITDMFSKTGFGDVQIAKAESLSRYDMIMAVKL